MIYLYHMIISFSIGRRKRKKVALPLQHSFGR